MGTWISTFSKAMQLPALTWVSMCLAWSAFWRSSVSIRVQIRRAVFSMCMALACSVSMLPFPTSISIIICQLYRISPYLMADAGIKRGG